MRSREGRLAIIPMWLLCRAEARIETLRTAESVYGLICHSGQSEDLPKMIRAASIDTHFQPCLVCGCLI